MGKEKKTINVLTTFFISHKSNVKTFLKWIFNQCHTAFVNMTLLSIDLSLLNENYEQFFKFEQQLMII